MNEISLYVNVMRYNHRSDVYHSIVTLPLLLYLQCYCQCAIVD